MHRAWITGLGLVLAMSGGAAQAEVSHSFHVPTQALVASGRAPDLIVLYTGNVVGYLEPCG